jgi:1,4-dihydroxy-2-naphthoate octaprenyltransferase
MEVAAPERDNRSIIAHVLMCAFILLTGIGFGLALNVGWGFVAAGICCGIYAFLLAWEPTPPIVVSGDK